MRAAWGTQVMKRRGEEYQLFWREDRADFVRLAAKYDALIVPFAAVGADDAYNLFLVPPCPAPRGPFLESPCLHAPTIAWDDADRSTWSSRFIILGPALRCECAQVIAHGLSMPEILLSQREQQSGLQIVARKPIRHPVAECNA